MRWQQQGHKRLSKKIFITVHIFVSAHVFFFFGDIKKNKMTNRPLSVSIYHDPLSPHENILEAFKNQGTRSNLRATPNPQ